MADLKLIAGERVRNINNYSDRKGWVGIVVTERTDIKMVSDSCYHVRFDNGTIQSYAKAHSSRYLERVEGERSYDLQLKTGEVVLTLCKQGRLGVGSVGMVAFVGKDEYVVDFGTEHLHFLKGVTSKTLKRTYGTSITEMYALDFARLEELAKRPSSYIMTVHDEIQFTPIQRRVLKKVRRNVINGKTQDDYVRDMGHARGVQQFNTRCLGRSTGQAMRIVGEAMCNPGVPIRWEDVDHAISEHGVPRHHANKSFQHTLWDVIGKREGFAISKGNGTIVFNPIVTEETYVERN